VQANDRRAADGAKDAVVNHWLANRKSGTEGGTLVCASLLIDK
jgi:hypothetical protein